MFTSTPTALTQSSTTPSRASSSRWPGACRAGTGPRRWPWGRSSPAPPAGPGAAGRWTRRCAGSRRTRGTPRRPAWLAEYTRGPGLADDHIADTAAALTCLDAAPPPSAPSPGWRCRCRWRCAPRRACRISLARTAMASCFCRSPIGGVDHRRVQHLAGAVHHRHLAAHCGSPGPGPW